DAVQDTFLGLVRSAVPLADVDNARAYLFAALRHAAAKLRARGRATRPLDVDVAVVEPRPPDLDRAVRLERALAELPADQREVIALKVDGGLTFAEVAACLGVSPNTAASRYRYALEKLRAALGGSGPDPPADPSDRPRPLDQGTRTMGYALIWIESLASVLLLVALVTAAATHWRYGGRAVPIVTALLLIASAVALTASIGYLHLRLD